MKKICYVVTISTTVKAFLISQLNYLSEHEFEVYVICSYDGNLQRMLGNKVKYIPIDIPRGISIKGSIKAISSLKKIFEKEKFDLVQYSTPNASLYAAIAGKMARCKIRNYHCMGFRYLGFHGVTKYVFKMIEKITCYISTDIECVSKSNLKLGISEKLFPREKATVIFYGSTGGVDLNKFNIVYRESWRKEIRDKYNLQEEDFVYGFVGRITRDKGINELLEAFFSMENEAKLLLIGDIEENNNLDPKLLEKSKINKNIIWVGKSNAVEKYYAAMDILVLPSYREGFGNAIIEAEAMGTPVIVSDIPGPRDTMESGKTGYLVECKDIRDLVEKMQKIKDRKIWTGFANCAHIYAKTKFDSCILNKYILKRKDLLIGKYYGS